MQKKYLVFASALILAAAVILSAGCVQQSSETPTVSILYSTVGNMPSLLSSGEVDGYIAWQPFVAVGQEGKVGKVLSYSENLPPAGAWDNHTCCVFGANTEALKNADVTNSLTALMMLANSYITENPDKAAALTADWLFANQDMTYGSVTVNSVDVMNASIPTIRFSSEVTDKWIASNEEFVKSQRAIEGMITGKLANTTSEETKALLFDFAPYEAAKAQITSGTFTTPAAVGKISIGYLASDHDAPLFILLKDWNFFKENYNCYLKPVTEKVGKISEAELYINGQKIADVSLVEGSAGPQLMTLLQQNQIQYAVAGVPPYINAIDKSTGAIGVKILAPIMMNGSGIVISNSSPANDWAGFVDWVKARSAEGKNVVIADPQRGSIQDVQLKAALDASGISYAVKSA